MIARVSELMLGGYESVTYYCTLCCRPFKALQEANEHAKFCGKAVLAQPTPDDDDDTQVYKKPWAGLTDEDIEATWSKLWKDINQMKVASEDRPQQETVRRLFARALEATLKKKNA